jgi:hypothetical protein
MTEENSARPDSDSTESHPGAETGNIRDRVRTLREEASRLSETLESVEKNLREASGETTG